MKDRTNFNYSLLRQIIYLPFKNCHIQLELNWQTERSQNALIIEQSLIRICSHAKMKSRRLFDYNLQIFINHKKKKFYLKLILAFDRT